MLLSPFGLLLLNPNHVTVLVYATALKKSCIDSAEVDSGNDHDFCKNKKIQHQAFTLCMTKTKRDTRTAFGIITLCVRGSNIFSFSREVKLQSYDLNTSGL